MTPQPTLLSVNNYYYYRGGAETVFLEHNRMFEQHGWRIVPFAMQHPRNLATPWSKYFIEQIEFGEQYSLRERLARVPKVIYSVEARRRLAALLDEARPDICHAHNIYHHISPSILSLLRERGVPTVMTLHDLKLACPAYNMLASDGICERCRGGRLHNVLVHRCIKGSAALSAVVMLEAVLHRLLGTYKNCVSRFVVPGRFHIEKLVEWGLPRSMFRHVPNFVDAQRYGPQYAPGDSFVYVGRLSREKGIATLIRAAALSRRKVCIVGTGPQLDELQQLAAQVGADVRFAGYLSGESLHAAIAQARAVVLPSEVYENAPMSVLEAYALGKPVIGSALGGIPELVQEGITGVTFASGDAAALAEKMDSIAGMPAFAVERMGRAGRAWVERDFTAAMYRERILEIYGELGVNGAAAPFTKAIA